MLAAKPNVDTIRQWIADGALENAGSKAKVVNKPKFEIALSAVDKGKPAGPPPMPPDKLDRTDRSHYSANAVTALAASPWAPLVAVAGQKQVLLYHADTLDLLGVLAVSRRITARLKFSRNGSLLLAGGGRGAKSGRVVVWSVSHGRADFRRRR